MRIWHTAVNYPADIRTHARPVALAQAVRLEDGRDARHGAVAAGVGEGVVGGLRVGVEAREGALDVDVFAVGGGEDRDDGPPGEEAGSGWDGVEGEDAQGVVDGGAEGNVIV